jgi:TetR/AcrR family transcriptional regulator, transcriptional repressor of bet genes
MSDLRRPYHRETVDQRRDALIQSALDLMAEGGPEAMTVRAIAARAGTTPGLIRHYFGTKDELIRCAFERFMGHMTQQSLSTIEPVVRDPVAALAAMICASLRPPVLDGERVRLWAGFLQMVQRHPAMRQTHAATYLGYRDRLQTLIEALPGKSDPAVARQLAIACNAVIDGLWLEGATLPDDFAEDEVEGIALAAISAILDTPLIADKKI